jgi:outer membrane immunogenic protein
MPEHRFGFSCTPVLALSALACVSLYGAAKSEPIWDKPAKNSAAFDWTGFYLGAGGGYGSLLGDKYVDVLGIWRSSSAVDTTAGYLTITGGFDYRVGDFVLGGFAEYDATNVSNADLSQASFGGRLGYLLTERMLVFASGGYSRMQIGDQSMSSLGYSNTLLSGFGYSVTTDGKVKFPASDGFFIGGGLETMLTKHISLRGEYRHTIFNEENVYLPEANFSVMDTLYAKFSLNDVATAKYKPESDIFRLTMSYKFGD